MAGRYDNTKRNQYNSTPRKVFDAYIDRMATRRDRDRIDHAMDIAALLKRIENIEYMHRELKEHVQHHCHVLMGDENLETVDHDSEELE